MDVQVYVGEWCLAAMIVTRGMFMALCPWIGPTDIHRMTLCQSTGYMCLAAQLHGLRIHYLPCGPWTLEALTV